MADELSAPTRSDAITGPGAPFEIVREAVLGEMMPVFRRRPRSARELLVESGDHLDHVYVVQGDRRVTFDDHLGEVAAFASVLCHDYGVGKGDRVAILAANRPEWIVAFWAAISSGAIVASMNAWWAAPELEDALAGCEPTVLVADAARLARMPRGAVPRSSKVVDMDTEFAGLVERGRGAELPTTPIDEDDPAVILYTSGTTGRSKGAVATHRSICGAVVLSRYSAARAHAELRAAGVDAAVGSRQTALVTVPLFHASGLYGFVVGQLASGGTIVLSAGRFDEAEVMGLIQTEQVTMWAALGSMGPRVARRALHDEADLSSVHLLAIGGAPVSPTTQDLLRSAFPNAALNLSMGYSSSEAVAVVTRNHGAEMRNHPTSAGRVLATTAVEIRDEHGRPVPDGVEGEIHVRSPYLMTGYWRDPEATAAVFKPGRWLAMGDVGRLEDGLLFIDSRARDMILVNAENVFPTEIEYRLDAHPDVVESAVVGVDDELTGQAIMAVVVERPGVQLTDEELATWCREALAGYKVPTSWVHRSEPLLRNPSGKIVKIDLAPADTP